MNRYPYKKLLVGLDQSEMDKDLIKAACDISQSSDTEVVYFLNVIREIQVPESLKQEFPDILDKALEERKATLQNTIDDCFKSDKTKVILKVIVEQGSVTKTLLKHTADDDIDLIVLGRKHDKDDGGVLVNRIARRVGCSMLIVPQNTKFDLSNILVPTDFSDYSKNAMDKAISMVKEGPSHKKLTIQNVFQVPVGYHYTGKSFDEFAEIMQAHTGNDYEKFMSEFDTSGIELEPVYSLDKDDDIIHDIYKTALKMDCTLIVVGAKGRTATTALFIGSKAERLIQVNTDVPMLVVRPKGKNAGFIEFLKEL